MLSERARCRLDELRREYPQVQLMVSRHEVQGGPSLEDCLVDAIARVEEQRMELDKDLGRACGLVEIMRAQRDEARLAKGPAKQA